MLLQNNFAWIATCASTAGRRSLEAMLCFMHIHGVQQLELIGLVRPLTTIVAKVCVAFGCSMKFLTLYWAGPQKTMVTSGKSAGAETCFEG